MKLPQRYRIKLLLAMIGFIPASLFAENSESQDQRAWIIMTSVPDELVKKSRIFSGDHYVELPTSKRRVSKPLPILNNSISIAKLTPNSQRGKSYMNISIPEKIQQALVIITPKQNAGGDLEFSSIVSDLSLFTSGDWLFVNTTVSTIRVVENGKAAEINPRSSIFSRGSSVGQVSKTVIISYDYRNKRSDKWSSLSSSSVVRSSINREICIFIENANTNAIDYYGLSFNAK